MIINWNVSLFNKDRQAVCPFTPFESSRTVGTLFQGNVSWKQQITEPCWHVNAYLWLLWVLVVSSVFNMTHWLCGLTIYGSANCLLNLGLLISSLYFVYFFVLLSFHRTFHIPAPKEVCKLQLHESATLYVSEADWLLKHKEVLA